MYRLTKSSRALPAVAAFLLLAVFPSIAFADTNVPSYAKQDGDTIKGTISGFNGAYTVYVRDANGYLDNVSLHRGTIINPTGIPLQTGFSVTVVGHPDGATFVADEIDTPYPYSPYPYAYAYSYPGPVVPFGFGYGYGYGYGHGFRWHGGFRGHR